VTHTRIGNETISENRMDRKPSVRVAMLANLGAPWGGRVPANYGYCSGPAGGQEIEPAPFLFNQNPGLIGAINYAKL
jgi:hypothetical protein